MFRKLIIFISCTFKFTLILLLTIGPAQSNPITEWFKQKTGLDSCRSYSDYTCDQLERSTYNVYFYFPDNTEYSLGKSYSLSGCGGLAHGYAKSKNLSRSDGWGYICCLETSNSSCAEKHR